MKTIKQAFIVSIFFCSIIAGCSKSGDGPSSGNNGNKTYPAPHWQAANSSLFAYSMTAVIGISDSLKQTVSSGDELAAFINDECRGVGVYIERENTSPVFYVLIKGAADESDSLTFKYYNKKSSYMYSAGNILNFEVDENYGTFDDPLVPELKPVTH